MKHNVYNLFLIAQALNGQLRLPIKSFISKNYDTAKLEFMEYVENSKNPSSLFLYKIGEIGKDLRVKECRIFIDGGLEIKNKKNYTKSDILKEKKLYEDAKFEKELSKQIEILFGGKSVK